MTKLDYVTTTDGRLEGNANDALCDLLCALVRRRIIEKCDVGGAKVWCIINDNQVLRGKEPL